MRAPGRRKLARQRHERDQTRWRCLAGGVAGSVLVVSITFTLLRSIGRAPAEFVGFAAVLGASYGIALAALTADRAGSQVALLWFVGLPMAAAATALFALSREVVDATWQALSLNLSATAIGVLVTVFFVDIVLRLQERDRWASAERFIMQELVTEADKLLTFLAGLHAGPLTTTTTETFDEETGDLLLNEDHLSYLRGDVLDGMPASLARLTEPQWTFVAEMLTQFRGDSHRFMALYGNRLSPELYTRVLHIELGLSSAQVFLGLRSRMPETAVGMIAIQFQMLIRDCEAMLRDHWDVW